MLRLPRDVLRHAGQRRHQIGDEQLRVIVFSVEAEPRDRVLFLRQRFAPSGQQRGLAKARRRRHDDDAAWSSLIEPVE
ncbi:MULTISPECIES: hypothetical protein [unclassified Paraburkholderia]|uniref:hypothetical protein n=1 Tax=unclassified Paraburkholderia TaxID=2615204 RepID=UPI0021A5F530|nr:MULTISPECIES: hypothetical protein [unclassified Paraburkholderia]